MRRLDLGELFFNGAGRLGRGVFMIVAAVLIASLELYDHLPGLGRLLAGWIVHPILFVSAACIISKRLHDRGRSGWWAALILLAFCLTWPQPRGAMGFISLAVLLWSAAELAVLPGVAGFNRYGRLPAGVRSAPPRP